ncbi:MAG: hypothetical protein V2A71_04120 [Candidatus Eisenbacteria bacterium]
MSEPRTEEEQSVETRERGKSVPMERRVLLFFLGLLVVGLVGYFALRGSPAHPFFAHVGALGIVGLFGGWAGVVAREKGHGYRRAFLLGLLLPVVSGVAAVIAVFLLGGGDGSFSCGGAVSLPVAMLVVVGYLLAKRRDG